MIKHTKIFTNNHAVRALAGLPCWQWRGVFGGMYHHNKWNKTGEEHIVMAANLEAQNG